MHHFFIIWHRTKQQNAEIAQLGIWHISYTAKLLLHQSPTRHSDYSIQWPDSECSHRWLLLAARWLSCKWQCSHHAAGSLYLWQLHCHCPVTNHVVTVLSRWLDDGIGVLLRTSYGIFSLVIYWTTTQSRNLGPILQNYCTRLSESQRKLWHAPYKYGTAQSLQMSTYLVLIKKSNVFCS